MIKVKAKGTSLHWLKLNIEELVLRWLKLKQWGLACIDLKLKHRWLACIGLIWISFMHTTSFKIHWNLTKSSTPEGRQIIFVQVAVWCRSLSFFFYIICIQHYATILYIDTCGHDPKISGSLKILWIKKNLLLRSSRGFYIVYEGIWYINFLLLRLKSCN